MCGFEFDEDQRKTIDKADALNTSFVKYLSLYPELGSQEEIIVGWNIPVRSPVLSQSPPDLPRQAQQLLPHFSGVGKHSTVRIGWTHDTTVSRQFHGRGQRVRGGVTVLTGANAGRSREIRTTSPEVSLPAASSAPYVS